MEVLEEGVGGGVHGWEGGLCGVGEWEGEGGGCGG